MGIREDYGQKIEDALNKMVDEKLDASGVKAEFYKAIDSFVDDKLADFKHKIKADLIDLIDGEDDIK